MIYFVTVFFIQIRNENKSAEEKYDELMNQISAYTRQKQLSDHMTKRLESYYFYRFRNSYFREKKILPILSGIYQLLSYYSIAIACIIFYFLHFHVDQLREEIVLHSCRRLVENVTLFRNLSTETVTSIISNLKFELYLPNDVIIKAGAQGDCMFFISSGTVAVLTPTGKEICHLVDGAHFGEVALLVQDQRRVATIVAIEVCEVYRLDRRNFHKCIATHAELFQRIERIATKRMDKTAVIEEQHKRFPVNRSSLSLSLRKNR